jgi:hypothetical protein
MADVSFWECPNCGGSDFAEIAPRKHRCVYCGTVLTEPEVAQERTDHTVVCPRCGFENERGDLYCNNCGRALVDGLVRRERGKMDPAVLSIIATLFGSMIIPFGGPILGLYLGYKALKDARAEDVGGRSEGLAKAAVVIGWSFVAFQVFFVCMALFMPGVQLGCSLCKDLLDGVTQVVSGLFSGGGGR